MSKGFARVTSFVTDSPPISQERQDAACEDFFLKIACSLIATTGEPNEDYTTWGEQLQRIFERKRANFVDHGNGHSPQIYDVLNFLDEEGDGVCLAEQPFSKENPWSNALGIATHRQRRDTFVQWCRDSGNIPQDQTILILHANKGVKNGKFRVILTEDNSQWEGTQHALD